MSRALLVLANAALREKAKRWIDRAPPMSRVEFKGPQRTTDQNSTMWLWLTAIAEQCDWCGIRMNPDQWKVWFLDALGGELNPVPNMAKTGFVNVGRSSSDLGRQDFSDLIELIVSFAAERGVRLPSAKELKVKTPQPKEQK